MAKSDKELARMEDAGYWDADRDENHAPAKKGRAILSVAFSREDFDRVAEVAEEAHMRVSEFVRGAALEKAARDFSTGRVASYSYNIACVVYASPIEVTGTSIPSIFKPELKEKAITA